MVSTLIWWMGTFPTNSQDTREDLSGNKLVSCYRLLAVKIGTLDTFVILIGNLDIASKLVATFIVMK